MGDLMGNIELDERGRLTIPAGIREKLGINPGDNLKIDVDNDKTIKIRKVATKQEIFDNLVGCIKVPADKPISVEEMKNIWKLV